MAIRAIRTIGGIGSAGPAGSSGGSAPAAPELTALAVTTTWRRLGNGWQYSFSIAATVPVADPNYSHLKTVQISATDSTISFDLSTSAPFSPDGSNKIYFESDWYDAPLPPSFSDSWNFTGYAINDIGTASGTPATAAAVVDAPSISAVTASEVANSVYQDQNEGLHMVVQISPTLTNPQYPMVITLWLDYDDGNGWVWQGWFAATGASPTFRIGDPTQSTGATTEPGTIWVPTDPTRVSWKAAAIAGAYSGATPPTGFAQHSFTVTAAAAPSTTDVTGAQFSPDPDTNDLIVYAKDSLGNYFWVPYELMWLQPSFGSNPYYWFSFFTVQKGYAATGTGTVSGGTSVSSLSGLTITDDDVGMDVHVNGVLRYITSVNVGANSFTLSAAVSNGAGQAIEIWRQAPDYEGKDDLQPQLTPADTFYKGRQVTASGAIQGGSSIPGTWVIWYGDHPPDWTFPAVSNLDGTPNLFRTFRFRLYSVSRLGANESGGSGAIVLQTWQSGDDHGDLTPAAQPSALDLSQTNPTTSFAGASPITGGNGAPLDIGLAVPLTVLAKQITVSNHGITDTYIADQAVKARAMDAAAVTYANAAIAGNAIVDSNVASVQLGKLIAGTVVFSGDIVLSRGSGNPVVVMNNTGMFLYSGGTASGSGVTPGVAGNPTYSASGLTSQPYVGIQSTQIGVFSSSGGPSVTITGSGVNLWSVNGNTASPYMNLTSSALAIHSGNFTLNVTASQIQLSYAFGASTTLNTSGLTIQNGNYSVTVGSTSIQLSVSGGASATLNSGGLTFQNGSYSVTVGSSSIVLTNGSATVSLGPSSVAITNGTLTLNLSGTTTTIANGSGFFGTAGLKVQNNSSHYGTSIEDAGVVVFNGSGLAAIQCILSGGSGFLNVFTQGGIGASINTDGVYQLSGNTIISTVAGLSQVQAAHVFSIGAFKTGIGGTSGVSGSFTPAGFTMVTVTNGIVTSIV
jgi:hypothetical protein